MKTETIAYIDGRPGKFQGEAAYVPYFYDAYLNGFADEDDGDALTFYVTTDDVAMFPELEGRGSVRLYISNDGFVIEDKAP